MLALRLPPKIEKRLEELARKTGRTKSFYAREAIQRHLDDLEGNYLAGKRLTPGREKIPFEELTSEIDDPFATFSEWAGEEDEKAYAGL